MTTTELLFEFYSGNSPITAREAPMVLCLKCLTVYSEYASSISGRTIIFTFELILMGNV